MMTARRVEEAGDRLRKLRQDEWSDLGLGALAWRLRRRGRACRAESVRLGAVYWHFMGAIWLVLFTLLYFVR